MIHTRRADAVSVNGLRAVFNVAALAPSDEKYAEQHALLVQEVGAEDFQIRVRRESRPEAAVLRVDELRVVDYADRVLAFGDGNRDELSEAVVCLRGWRVGVQLVHHARDVVHVRVRLDDLRYPVHPFRPARGATTPAPCRESTTEVAARRV